MIEEIVDSETYPSFNWDNAISNPFLAEFSTPLWLSKARVGYFSGLSDETGVPMEVLINRVLHEAADAKWRPDEA